MTELFPVTIDGVRGATGSLLPSLARGRDFAFPCSSLFLLSGGFEDTLWLVCVVFLFQEFFLSAIILCCLQWLLFWFHFFNW